MTKKILSFALSALLLNLCGACRVLAATKDKRDGDAANAKRETSRQEAAAAKAVEKVKKKVAEIGTGRELVAVKLREQGKNVGYISEIAEDHFMLTDSKDGVTIKVGYADVKSIRRSHLTPDSMKVLSIVSVGLMAAVLVGVLVAASRE